MVTVVIMLFVIPQFKALFSSFGADLPAFTLLVIAMSDFMHEYWWAIALGVGGFVYFIRNVFQRSAAFRGIVDRAVLKIPVIGNILNKAALARFARTLSTMFAAGVPLVEALESVAGATGNIVYTEAQRKRKREPANRHRVSRQQGQSLRRRVAGSLFRLLAGQDRARTSQRLSRLLPGHPAHDCRSHRRQGARRRGWAFSSSGVDRRSHCRPKAGPARVSLLGDRRLDSHPPRPVARVRPKAGQPWQLYNVATDPSESKNLAAAQPEILGKLTALAEKAHEPAREGTFTTTERHQRDRRAKFGKQDEPDAPKAKAKRKSKLP